jgi:hypothetical protein
VRAGRAGQGRQPGDWLLGVDIGTGSVKALAVTLDGRPLPISGPFFSRFIANAVTETGERLTERRYGEPQSSLDTHLGGIDLLVLGASREAGIDTGVVTAIRDSFAAAVAAGHGADDIAILADLPAARPVE